MRVADLTGAELDAWVARAEGVEPDYPRIDRTRMWGECGPLVEKYDIAVFPVVEGWGAAVHQKGTDTEGWQDGTTPQEAICRAVVAHVFGEEV